MLCMLVCTRPDIAQAVGALSKFMAAPTTTHWQAATGELRYLAGVTMAWVRSNVPSGCVPQGMHMTWRCASDIRGV